MQLYILIHIFILTYQLNFRLELRIFIIFIVIYNNHLIFIIKMFFFFYLRGVSGLAYAHHDYSPRPTGHPTSPGAGKAPRE